MFKQKKYLLVIFLILSKILGLAQNIENPVDTNLINKYKQTKVVSYIIKTNLLPMLYSKLPLTAEYRLLGEFTVSPRQSVCIGGSYLGKTILYSLFVNNTYYNGLRIYIKGYRFQLAYKYYLVQKKFTPMGIYLSPHFSYFAADYYYAHMSNNADYDRLTNFNANLLFGVQIIAKNTVAFDLFTGWGYNNYTYIQYVHVNNVKKTIHKDPKDFGGILNSSHINYIPIGFNFGLAF